MKSFKIREKIKEAWPLFKNNLAMFFLILAILYVGGVISEKNNIFLSLGIFVLGIFIAYMIIKFLLSLVNGTEFSPFEKKSLPSLRQLWNFIKTYILLGLITAGGFMVLFIPGFLILNKTMVMTPLITSLFVSSLIFLIIGVYLSVRLVFSMFISIDKNYGARKSIKESWRITKGHFWQLFGKIILIQLFMLVGFLAFFVGAIITYPLGMILSVMLYKHYRE